MNRIEWVVMGCLLAIYGFLILQPINLTAVDLGRHIKNGELILKGNFQVLYQNFYSYTYPDFPFVNHHWGSGVIFYLIHQLAGFAGLSIFFLVISLITFWLFFDLARRNSDIFLATVIAIILSPLLLARTEIRPEIFSYFFLGIYFRIFHQPKPKILSLLIPLQVVWVNLHIYWFMGIALAGLFLSKALVENLLFKQKNTKLLKKLTLIFFALILVSIINPLGVKGLLAPFTIKQNYGYRVLENQNLWFLFKVIHDPMVWYFGLAFCLLWGSFLYKFWTGKKPLTATFLSYLGLSFGFTLIGFIMLRNVSIFALFALPIISFNLSSLKTRLAPTPGVLFSWITGYLVLVVMILVINPSAWQNRQFGIGLYQGIEEGAQFYKQNRLKGPIFNNYDIGSYLSYELYPEKVFVDNRPEAYPSEFFQNVYIPSQEDEQKWQTLDQKYQFNTIFFYRPDLTPWAQKFLISKVKDPQWAPVYVDDFSIIFVKRNNPNASIIKEFEIPKDRFNTEGK